MVGGEWYMISMGIFGTTLIIKTDDVISRRMDLDQHGLFMGE